MASRRPRSFRYLFLAVLIAMVLWSVAHSSSSVERAYDIPVAFEKLPEDLVITDQSSDEVNVRVRGSRAALRNLSPTELVCTPEMDLFGVVDRFLSTNFPLMPVVDDQILVGVISRRDTLRGIQELRRRIDKERAKQEKAAGHQADRPRSIESMQRTAASRTKEQMARLFGRK